MNDYVDTLALLSFAGYWLQLVRPSRWSFMSWSSVLKHLTRSK